MPKEMEGAAVDGAGHLKHLTDRGSGFSEFLDDGFLSMVWYWNDLFHNYVYEQR